MQVAWQLGLRCVGVEIIGEKPLHKIFSSNDKLCSLFLSKLILKSPIMIVLLLGLIDDSILEKISLKFFLRQTNLRPEIHLHSHKQ